MLVIRFLSLYFCVIFASKCNNLQKEISTCTYTLMQRLYISDMLLISYTFTWHSLHNQMSLNCMTLIYICQFNIVNHG